MADWKHEIDFSGFWHDQLEPREIARRMREAIISAFPEWQEEMQLADLVDELEWYSSDVCNTTLKHIDLLYGELCDWGDDQHYCRIRTF